MKKLLNNRRGILTLLAIVMLVTAALGGAIPYLYQALPEPAKANRQELLRWLITRDIAKEPPEIQAALADRLEAEFGSGVDWESFRGKINDSQREQLIKNIPAVLRPWMLNKADAYGQLTADCRTAFLDRLIDTLEVWKGVEKLMPKPASNTLNDAESPKLATIMMKEMEKLQKEAPSAQQKKIGDLWTAVQTRWFLRSFAPKT